MRYFDKERLTIKLNNWLEELSNDELSANTLKRYKINITSFILFADKKEIDKNTIKQYKAKLEEIDKYLANTINNYLIALNKFLKYLGYSNLTVKLVKVQRKDAADENLDYTDYHRLLRTASQKNDIQMHLIMRVLGETGIRIAELKYFKVEDLDKKLIIKNKGKIRTIIIRKELLTVLRKYANKNHIYSGYLFFGRNRKKSINESTIRKRLKRIAGQARVKLSKVYPHNFRHYFAKRYLEMYPDDIIGLADLLGHAQLETTRIYVKSSNYEKERKLRNIKF